jgi:hypothetical protein
MGDIFINCKLRYDGIAYPLPREVPALLQSGAVMVDLRSELEKEVRGSVRWQAWPEASLIGKRMVCRCGQESTSL